jgi:hypothetical protein
MPAETASHSKRVDLMALATGASYRSGSKIGPVAKP